MKKVKVLVWFPYKIVYWIDILKKVEKRYGIECKDRTDFGFETGYLSQNDFDRINCMFNPDIVFLWNITLAKMVIKIPEDIKVLTYCDHFYEQFLILGRPYFEHLNHNNYLYMPILDAGRIDKDHVLEDKRIRDKILFAPYVTSLNENNIVKNKQDSKRFGCDLSVISSFKDIDYYYWCFNINQNSSSGKILMHFICELVVLIRNKIRETEKICLEDKWIHELIIRVFEKLGVKHYVYDINEFIRVWHIALKYNIIPHEYMNVVVEWLINEEYDLKIYGSGWDKNDAYKKFAFGQVEENTADLCKVFQYSKINIGTNVSMGIHRRNIEVIQNDCLCFQAEAKDNYMFSDYNHFFQDGINIITYKNKNELFHKINFYLSNDLERKKVIEAGKVIIKKYLQPEEIVGNSITKILEK